MNPVEEISKELLTVAPTLAGLQKRNYVAAPQGYFERFVLQMLDLIDAEVKERQVERLQAVLKKTTAATPPVPEQYFNTFATTLLQKIKAEEAAAELQEIAPMLNRLTKTYSPPVPADYFANFPAQMLQRVQPPAAPALPAWLQGLNNLLENALAPLFKPRYALAFAGTASVLLMAAMFFIKVQQCTDLECKMAAITNEELDAYFATHADEFNTNLLEYSADDKNIQEQTNALNRLSDEELNDLLID